MVVQTHTVLNQALLSVEDKYPDSVVHARLDGEMVILEGSIGDRTDAVGILEILGEAVGKGLIIDASRLTVEGMVLASSDTLSSPTIQRLDLSAESHDEVDSE